MDNALRKLVQSVQVIRGLHRSEGGRDNEPAEWTERQNLIENHSSAIAGAMQSHFGVPVSVSKSKTSSGVSHYVRPQFDLPGGKLPFVVRVSDHAAWVPRLHQTEHHVYPKKGDTPEKFINESLDSAKKYGQRIGVFPKEEFVPLKGDVYHQTFGKGTVIDSQPNVAKVDFGDKGIKNISSRFLHQSDITKSEGGEVVRTKRSTGGRIPDVDKLFKKAKKTLDGQTKPMLNVHDDAIVHALRIAQGRV